MWSEIRSEQHGIGKRVVLINITIYAQYTYYLYVKTFNVVINHDYINKLKIVNP